MIEKHYHTILSQTASAHDAVEWIENSGYCALRITFFIKATDNQTYKALSDTLRDECRAKLGSRCPMLVFVAQEPMGATLSAVVTTVDATYYDQITFYEDYLMLGEEILSGGICADTSLDIAAQSEKIFGRIKSIFAAHDFAVESIVRQWNYIENITLMSEKGQHYQLFNDERSHFYSLADWSNGYPAATGIGAQAGGVVVVFDAHRRGNQETLPIDNPLQISAHNYSQQVLIANREYHKTTPKFERARYVSHPHACSVYVSGTAAIRGEESCLQGVVEQTEMTMDNINHLVNEQNLLAHSVMSPAKMNYEVLIVYIKNKAHTQQARQWLMENYPNIPALYLWADICREELLIEIEAIAIA